MSLRIFHTADLHGAQSVYRTVSELRNPDTDLFLDAGDTIAGSNSAFRWSEPNLETLTNLNCDAVTMGNRELHYLPLVRARRFRQGKFPLLAANLVDLRGRSLTWREGVSVTRAGSRVGIFGMTVVQYPVGSWYERFFGLRFLSPETLIESLVERYQRDHDVVVFLSHLGWDWDRRLAQKLLVRRDLRLDLILGGHSHNRFRTPERIGSTLIGHVGAHGTHFGLWEKTPGLGWDFKLYTESGSLE